MSDVPGFAGEQSPAQTVERTLLYATMAPQRGRTLFLSVDRRSGETCSSSNPATGSSQDKEGWVRLLLQASMSGFFRCACTSHFRKVVYQVYQQLAVDIDREC